MQGYFTAIVDIKKRYMRVRFSQIELYINDGKKKNTFAVYIITCLWTPGHSC